MEVEVVNDSDSGSPHAYASSSRSRCPAALNPSHASQDIVNGHGYSPIFYGILNSTPSTKVRLNLSGAWNQSTIFGDDASVLAIIGTTKQVETSIDTYDLNESHESDASHSGMSGMSGIDTIRQTQRFETSQDTYYLDGSCIPDAADTTRPGSRRIDTSIDTYCLDGSVQAIPKETAEGKAVSLSSPERGARDNDKTSNTGVKKSRRPSVRIDAEVIELYDLRCCERRCMWDLSPRTIIEKESFFHSKSEVQQRQFLLDDLYQHAYISNNQIICKYMIHGRTLCEEAYLTVFNVKKRRLQDVKSLYKDGVRKVIHKNEGSDKQMVKTASTIGWMTLNLGRMGDFMPHENRVYLPVCDTKKMYYERMVGEIFKDKEKVTYGYFVDLWKKNFSNYIVGKPSTFTQCNDCVQLAEDQRKLPSEKDRKEAAEMLVMHKRQAEIERRHYHTRRIAAQQNPEEWLAIIIDGMDQSKTDVPHLVQESKSTAGLLRLKTHVTGVLVHTDCKEGKEAYAYIDVTEYPHDANLTMHILLDILVKYMHKPARKLHIQLDNCFRENKNRFVLSLGWLLVELCIFDEIHFSFLPVGHTHEDVDQMFSRISVKLKGTDVYTLDGLHDAIHKSYTPNVNVIRIMKVWDIKEWLSPGMETLWGNHSKPHHFVFKRIDGETQMFYRKWVTDSWRPNEEGHDLELIADEEEVIAPEFKNGIKCMKGIPDMSAIPGLVDPMPRKWTMADLEKTIPASYGKRIPDMYIQWWKDFHKTTKTYLQGTPLESAENDALWSLKELEQRPRQTPEVVVENEHLAKMRKRLLEDCPMVFVGGKRPSKKHRVPTQTTEGDVGVANAIDDASEGRDERISYTFDGNLDINDIVIVDVPGYGDEWPLMGQVIDVGDLDSCLIQFYGAIGRLRLGQKWTPARMRESMYKAVPYITEIDKTCIKLKGFKVEEGEVIINQDMLDSLLKLKESLSNKTM